MAKITPCLWFDGNAEEAANFYVTLLPDSRVNNVARSFVIDCADQAEVDRLWDVLIADGGSPSQCAWLKDRFGVSWQIVPRQLGEMLGDPDREGAGRAMEAMLQMTKIDVAAMRRAFDGEAAG